MSLPREIHERIDALPPELAGELVSFLDYLAHKDAERKRLAFEEWAATCPEDNEPVSPELAARLDEALAEAARGETVPLEELMAGDSLESSKRPKTENGSTRPSERALTRHYSSSPRN